MEGKRQRDGNKRGETNKDKKNYRVKEMKREDGKGGDREREKQDQRDRKRESETWKQETNKDKKR